MEMCLSWLYIDQKKSNNWGQNQLFKKSKGNSCYNHTLISSRVSVSEVSFPGSISPRGYLLPFCYSKIDIQTFWQHKEFSKTLPFSFRCSLPRMFLVPVVFLLKSLLHNCSDMKERKKKGQDVAYVYVMSYYIICSGCLKYIHGYAHVWLKCVLFLLAVLCYTDYTSCVQWNTCFRTWFTVKYLNSLKRCIGEILLVWGSS